MSNLDLTVVFPTYNRPAEVAHTLELLRKNIHLRYEVVIIDNSPERHSYSLCENEKYYFVGRNLGTAARNIGIEKASAPYIMMLDDDSHPFPGSVEAGIAGLEKCGDETGGVTGPVLRLDGGLENPPLLPTAFHGCGALFRTEALRKTGQFYPDDFCFYGEEYWSTLKFYRNGYRFKFLPCFKVCHRMSSSGRDVGRILYYLTLNNRRTWKPFIPVKYFARAMYDTCRRYELIAEKENVKDSYVRAMAEKIELHDGADKMSEKSFEDFALISGFRKLFTDSSVKKGDRVVLCGAGKFPTIWADFLKFNGVAEILISDLNPGICGHRYGDYDVVLPEEAAAIKGALHLFGHTSRADASTWNTFLKKKNLENIINLPEC